MILSDIGRAALKSREGERLTAYKDSVGVWTISVGVTTASGLITVTPGLKITAAQSDALFSKAVEKYAATVRNSIKKPCTQEQFDAMVSFCYNIGQGGFSNSSAVRLFNAGDVAKAADALLMWKKPAEILPRRRAERLQFLTPYAKALPRARDTDAKPVQTPLVSSVPAPPATPAVTVVSKAPVKPAPAGGIWAWLRSFSKS